MEKRKAEILNKLNKNNINKSNNTYIKMDYPKKTIEVTDANFNEIVQKYPIVVVDCWAPWCMPCKMIEPTLEQLAQEMAGRVVFGKLNVDNNREVPTKYGVTGIPCLLIFKNSERVDSIVGAVPKQHIEEKLKPLID